MGYYLDIEENIFKPCNEKCKTCSLESMNQNLCIICNIVNNYYPKFNDSSNMNSFYECYNNDEEQIGYYLDNEENIYKQCYEKCKKCNGDGDDVHNNCIECNTEDNLYNLTDGNCIYFSNNFHMKFLVDYG